MRRILPVLILLFVFSACNQQDPEEQIKYLDGYWEIESVEISEDSIREYKFNETIDFIEIDGREGFRKKVRPQLDGTFQVTDDEEKVEVKVEDKFVFLYYSTPYDSWKEKLVEAKENELTMENERGIRYHYKRYTPLINNYEEE